MTVEDILKEWLKEHGYDGLYSDECGCWLNDFAPCDERCMECKPGVEQTAGPDSEWAGEKVIGPKKED